MATGLGNILDKTAVGGKRTTPDTTRKPQGKDKGKEEVREKGSQRKE